MRKPELNSPLVDIEDRRAFCRSRAAVAHYFFRDRHGNPWIPRVYQEDSLESTSLRKVHCDGRDVGKTSEIEIMAVWSMLSCPNTEMLIATQTANHLRPLMDRIVRRFETDPLLSKALLEVRRTPSWTLRFSNDFVLWGRIAGPRGINFQGLHVDHQIVDEAQEMTENAWHELYQALNAGGARWVYGVPNGLRNSFYRMSLDKTLEQHNWPSDEHPDWDRAKDEELARLYGGRSSPAYIHRVLGQHGMPAHGVFNLDDYIACVDTSIDFVNIELSEDTCNSNTGENRFFEAPGKNGDCTKRSEERAQRVDCPHFFEAPCNITVGEYHLGCDLGYARDPSEFVIFRNEEPYLINVARIRLAGVNYARQVAVIQELDRAYNFTGIAIDAGNNGRAVSHQLMSIDDHWCMRVRCIDFAGTIEMDPLPDGTLPKRNQKEFMTELLVRRMAERTIRFPELDQRENQYANHTYSIGHNGRILYDKLNDHLIDADRCAILSHYLTARQQPPHISRPLFATVPQNTRWPWR